MLECLNYSLTTQNLKYTCLKKDDLNTGSYREQTHFINIIQAFINFFNKNIY